MTLRRVPRRPRANCRRDLCRLLVCRADSCRHLPRTCAARLVCPNPCFRASDAWRRHVIIYVFMCMFLTLMAVLAGYGFITQRKREFTACTELRYHCNSEQLAKSHAGASSFSPPNECQAARILVRTPASHVTAYPTKSHSDIITRRAVGALRPRPRVQWLK